MEAVDRNGEPTGSLSIPVIAEELEIRKEKLVTGSIRITKAVHQREQVIDVPTVKSTVLIERVPIGKMLDEQPSIRYEGERTTIYPVVEEVVIVTRKYLLKEEIRISRQESTEPKSKSFLLRTEEVTVQREDAPPTSSSDLSSSLPFTEGVFHLEETAEQPVVTKRARVVEEVNLNPETSERIVKVADTVRKTEITIESLEGSK